MRNSTLEKLSWVLIFAGLFVASLGAFVHAYSPSSGWALMLAGGLGAAVGAVLIVVRSRRPD